MDETVLLEEICMDKTTPYDVSYMSALLVSLCTAMPTVSLQQNVTFNLFFFFFSGDIKIVLESSASYLYHLISHLCNNPVLKSSSFPLAPEYHPSTLLLLHLPPQAAFALAFKQLAAKGIQWRNTAQPSTFIISVILEELLA